MISFKELNLDIVYDTTDTNSSIDNDLMIPLLKNTKLYKRGVGYFSSSWIKIVSTGLLELVDNNGKIELVTSPKLTKEDWDAIKIGTMAQKDEVLKNVIKNTIDKEFIVKDLEEALTLFSWLIADGYIDLKIALCKDSFGDYHDKLAIFEDFDGNKVVLHGSLNDSQKGIESNGEGVSVFKNWIEGQKDYVVKHDMRFEKIWNDQNPFYEIYEAGDAIKMVFEEYAHSHKKPYSKKKSNEDKYEKREYQETAVNNLKLNNWRGIFSMATGTGKTITSLIALKDIKNEYKKCFFIVYAPQTHLVEQWSREFYEFYGFEPILCYDSQNSWFSKLSGKVRDYNHNINNTNFVVAIATYATGSSKDFIKIISQVRENLGIIADECHNIGSSTYSYILETDFKFRIGLSATPERWMDSEGTNKMMSFFDKVVYEYSLKEAIRNDKLTKYKYHPILVSLDYDEYYKYNELTNKISQMSSYMNEDADEEYKELYKRKCIERAKLLILANEKIETTMMLLKERYNYDDKSHILVYCGEKQISTMTELIAPIGYKTHKFDRTVKNKERQLILEKFDQGDIDLLVAIRCLDEGVDVPSTKTAYFMGSNSNPKQFIQRRGRVLRKCKNKEYAEIYDLVVVPNKAISSRFENGRSLDESILKKELPRVLEFADCSDNKTEALNGIIPIISEYNLELYLSMEPSEIFKLNKGVEDNEEY